MLYAKQRGGSNLLPPCSMPNNEAAVTYCPHALCQTTRRQDSPWRWHLSTKPRDFI